MANLYHCAKLYHGYVIADWLIDFSGGFVRRGLGGYFTLHLSDWLGLEANFTVNLLQIFFYLVYMVLMFQLIKRKQLDIWFLILLLSPVTLLFPIVDVCAVGRKEIILFSLFGGYLLCLTKGWMRSGLLTGFFAIALLIATFFHELIFFYTPYFILAAYIQSAKEGSTFRFKAPLLLISGSLLAIVPLFLFGKSIDGPAICAQLTGRGLDERICSGILTGPTEYTVRYIVEQAWSSGYFTSYGLALLLGLIPFVLFVYYSRSTLVTVKQFLLVFSLLFLFSAPLFVLAVDWGRWINIHFVLLLFTATLFLKDRLPADTWKNEYLHIPDLWKSATSSSKLINNAVFIAICFCYLSFWQMRHFNSFPVFYTDRYSDLKIEIVKTIDIANELFPYEFY